MNKPEHPEICVVCGDGPFVKLQVSKRTGYELWGCPKNRHTQMCKPTNVETPPVYGFWGIYPLKEGKCQ